MLKEFLKEQKLDLEKIIRRAAARYYAAHKDNSNLLFDFSECEKEALNLSRGEDLCYDRPCIGLSYSLWYQGRRINTFLNYFTQEIENVESDVQQIDVFDLGAGTGAVQMAVALCYVGLKRENRQVPQFSFHNLDTSGFMLDYFRTYLWPEFLVTYPEAKELKSQYFLNSWTDDLELSFSRTWLCASYLFDHDEVIEELINDFVSLVGKIKADKVLLTTSAQPKKAEYVSKLSSMLIRNGYSQLKGKSELLYSGSMNHLKEGRVKFGALIGYNFKFHPIWDDRSLLGVVFRRVTQTFGYSNLEPADASELNVFKPPIVVRRKIKLNQEQASAAKITGRPKVVLGPAGCGKSIVITERVKNLILAHENTNKQKILVTTFNKALIFTLRKWILEVLDGKVTESNDGLIVSNGESKSEIHLMHFDVLPTRLGNLKGEVLTGQEELNVLRASIEAVLSEDEREKLNWLSAEFMIEEIHRVIYGKDVNTFIDYVNVDRKGRQVKLIASQRRNIWKVYTEFRRRLTNIDITTFTLRRWEFLKQLNSNSPQVNFFDYILVDELQDCTASDYKIFYRLIKDPNRILFAGDYAQAVHLGASVENLRSGANTNMRNFDWVRLKGSYRLPFRISQCIKPISLNLKFTHPDAEEITPYKGAPPGARPILVFGSDYSKLARKVIEIVKLYNCYDVVDLDNTDGRKITVLEYDNTLRRALNLEIPNIAETNSILKLKGLEKTCVLWSTSSVIAHRDEFAEFLYTIFTRTAGLLIIGIASEISSQQYIDVIKMLDPKRLIVWDQESKNFYENTIL